MDRFLAWVQILTALGVLAGLAMVLVQLEQNEELVRLQLATEIRGVRDANRTALRGENYSETLAKVNAGKELSDAELLQFLMHADSLYEELTLRQFFTEVGVFKGGYKSWLVVESCETLNNEVGRAWLDYGLMLYPEDEVIKHLVERINECKSSFIEFMRASELKAE